jgi:hypothetical protein
VVIAVSDVRQELGLPLVHATLVFVLYYHSQLFLRRYSSTLKMETGTLYETPLHIFQAIRIISHEILTGL